ncbi:MAG: type III pantothenate kinase [Pyrinomonadaceae bacterium]
MENGKWFLNIFHFPFFIMLLTIDIGNSLTKFGYFKDEFLFERIAIPTVRTATADGIYNQTPTHSIHSIVISSVVPELHNSYKEFSEKYFKLAPIFVDSTFDFGLKIKYHPPENLGIDRIVDAFAAVEKYGKPCIICDFGTATTIDAVNSNGEFLGGIIAPGIKTFADSLHSKTSKLPQVEIKKSASVIGDSTVASIQAGIFFGYIGLVENILKKMFEELGAKPRIVATGGFAELISESVELIETVDKNLTLDGLRLIYEKILKR